MLKIAVAFATFAAAVTPAHAGATRTIETPNGGHEILQLEVSCIDAADTGYPVPSIAGRLVQYIAPNGQVTEMGCWEKSADGKLNIAWAGTDPTGSTQAAPLRNKGALPGSAKYSGFLVNLNNGGQEWLSEKPCAEMAKMGVPVPSRVGYLVIISDANGDLNRSGCYTRPYKDQSIVSVKWSDGETREYTGAPFAGERPAQTTSPAPTQQPSDTHAPGAQGEIARYMKALAKQKASDDARANAFK